MTGTGRRALAIVYVLALLMSTIDITIVNVALPSIGRDFNVGASDLGAVSTSYLAAIAAVISAAAWFEQRLGGKTAFLVSIFIFTIASIACGLAPTFLILVLARVLQGMGSGLLAPIGLGLLYRAYAPTERVRILGTTSLVTGLAPILGPALGGLLVSTLSWRLVFLVNAPIGTAALLYGTLKLKQPAHRDHVSLDGVAYLLAAGGLVLLVLGLSAGADLRWSTTPPVATAAIGVVLLAGFTRRTLRGRHPPLLRLPLLSQRPFGPGAVVVLLGNASFFGALYVIALFLQTALRLTPATAGLAMLTEAVPVLLGTQLTTRVLLPRFPPYRVLLVGLLGLTAALTLMAITAQAITHGTFLPLLALLGASWSLVFIPVSIAANQRISGDATSQAATLLSTIRQLASALGIALAASAITASTAQPGSFTSPFVLLAVLALAAALASTRLRS